MDAHKLYETLTGLPYPEAQGQAAVLGRQAQADAKGEVRDGLADAVETVRQALPKKEWPLLRKLSWFTGYFSVFAVVAYLILPHG